MAKHKHIQLPATPSATSPSQLHALSPSQLESAQALPTDKKKSRFEHHYNTATISPEEVLSMSIFNTFTTVLSIAPELQVVLWTSSQFGSWFSVGILQRKWWGSDMMRVLVTSSGMPITATPVQLLYRMLWLPLPMAQHTILTSSNWISLSGWCDAITLSILLKTLSSKIFYTVSMQTCPFPHAPPFRTMLKRSSNLPKSSSHRCSRYAITLFVYPPLILFVGLHWQVSSWDWWMDVWDPFGIR